MSLSASARLAARAVWALLEAEYLHHRDHPTGGMVLWRPQEPDRRVLWNPVTLEYRTLDNRRGWGYYGAMRALGLDLCPATLAMAGDPPSDEYGAVSRQRARPVSPWPRPEPTPDTVDRHATALRSYGA